MQQALQLGKAQKSRSGFGASPSGKSDFMSYFGLNGQFLIFIFELGIK